MSDTTPREPNEMVHKFKNKRTGRQIKANEPLVAHNLIDGAGLSTKARDMAVRGLPAGDEQIPTRIEEAMTDGIRQRVSERRDDFNERNEELCSLAAAAPTGVSDANLNALDNESSGDIVAVIHEAAHDITDTLRPERHAKARLNHYEDEHGHLINHREPEFPDSALGHCASLGVFFIIEACVAAILLFPASRTGFIGAVLTAMTLSGISIALAGVLGFIPARFYNLPEHRRWSAPLLIAGGLLLLIAAYLSAHYRQIALTANETLNSMSVLSHAFLKPFDLSLESIGLGCLQLAFSALAFWKGYTLDDPLPGYGKVQRKWLECNEEHENLRNYLRNRLSTLRSEKLINVTQANQSRELANRLSERLADFLTCKMRYFDLDKSDARALEKALEHFRATNIRVRTDGEIPAYFKFYPDLSDVSLDQDDFSGTPDIVKQTIAAHDIYMEKLQKFYAGQLAKFDLAIDKIDDIMEAVFDRIGDKDAVPTMTELRTALSLKGEELNAAFGQARSPTALPANDNQAEDKNHSEALSASSCPTTKH